MKLLLALLTGLVLSQAALAQQEEEQPQQEKTPTTTCVVFYTENMETEELAVIRQVQAELTTEPRSFMLVNLMVIEDTGVAFHAKRTEHGILMSLMGLSRLDPEAGYAPLARTSVFPGNALFYSPMDSKQAFLVACQDEE